MRPTDGPGRRRALLHALAGAACAAMPVLARAARRPYRLGVLLLGESAARSPEMNAFVERLAQLGLMEGRNLLVDRQLIGEHADRMEVPAAALAARKPDVIFTTCGTRCALAAKRATSTIPIVFDASFDPVATGLVASLPRPGANLTGGMIPSGELNFKRIQLLQETVGRTAAVAVLEQRINEPNRALFIERLSAFSASAGTRMQLIEVPEFDALEATFARIAQQRYAALAVNMSPLTRQYAPRIAALAEEHRLPAIADGEEFMRAGLLMTYTTDFVELYQQAADKVHRILAGAAPGELPVMQPARYQMSINLKTARRLGLTIPPAVLLRADRIVQ